MDEVFKLALLPPISETLADHSGAIEELLPPVARRESRVSIE
jgi:hypothetical protein